jgi:suppressor for copper-sensitivity B
MVDGPAARRAVVRYLGAIAVGNLVWEVFQLPLFTLWRTASPAYLAFAALHCWAGDLLIASATLGLGIMVAGRPWPSRGCARVATVTILLGVGYTVFSEWLNVAVRGSWAYAPAMPRVPPLGTGLSPLLQWIIVPLGGFVVSRPRSRAGQHAVLVAASVVALAMLGGPARAAASNWDSHEHGAARLISATEATGSSAQLDVGLQLRLTPGWHTYWRTPGDAGLAPTIDWKGSENLSVARIDWPAPRHLPPLGGLQTYGYEDGVVLPIAVTLLHLGAALHLHAEVDYASCKEICIPYHASLDLALPSGLALPGPQAPLIAAARARVPGDLAEARLRLLGVVVGSAGGGAVLSVHLASTGAPLQAPDLFVEGLDNVAASAADVALANDGHTATLSVRIRGRPAAVLARTKLHLTVVDGARSAETDAIPLLGAVAPMPKHPGRLAIIGLALLGGLVLNLMPCVLPVLSLKLLALLGHAGAERQGRFGLLATAAGVIVSFGVLAAALILLKQAGAAVGWGIQFQQPWFLAAMALVTTLFAASLWGWVPIALPGGVADAVGSVRGRGRLTDAFLLGAFATLLAASCSAPFVGTAIGFALARGPLEIVLIFTALGLGMAAPFLAVAAWPGVVSWLPRPGPWMDWLRRMLGLALLGTAGWLLSVLAAESGLWSALAAGMALLVLLILVMARAVLRFGRYGGRAIEAAAITLSIAAVLAPSLYGRAVSIEAPDGIAQTGLWRPYDAVALRGLVAAGQVVFVDVSAAWCLACKVNELAVLERVPAADKLRGPGVVTMRADWTHPDPTVTAYLQSFGRYGVPLDVVYGPRAPAGIALPELLTSSAVMDAFRRATSGLARPEKAAE